MKTMFDPYILQNKAQHCDEIFIGNRLRNKKMIGL